MSFDKLKANGWSVGYFSFYHAERGELWSTDARKNGLHFIVSAEVLDVAFFELEKQCREITDNELWAGR